MTRSAPDVVEASTLIGGGPEAALDTRLVHSPLPARRRHEPDVLRARSLSWMGGLIPTCPNRDYRDQASCCHRHRVHAMWPVVSKADRLVASSRHEGRGAADEAAAESPRHDATGAGRRGIVPRRLAERFKRVVSPKASVGGRPQGSFLGSGGANSPRAIGVSRPRLPSRTCSANQPLGQRTHSPDGRIKPTRHRGICHCTVEREAGNPTLGLARACSAAHAVGSARAVMRACSAAHPSSCGDHCDRSASTQRCRSRKSNGLVTGHAARASRSHRTPHTRLCTYTLQLSIGKEKVTCGLRAARASPMHFGFLRARLLASLCFVPCVIGRSARAAPDGNLILWRQLALTAEVHNRMAWASATRSSSASSP